MSKYVMVPVEKLSELALDLWQESATVSYAKRLDALIAAALPAQQAQEQPKCGNTPYDEAPFTIEQPQAQDERCAFEKWAMPDGVQARKDAEGNYCDVGMSAGWSAWQARAALPAKQEVEPFDTAPEGDNKVWGALAWMYRRMVNGYGRLPFVEEAMAEAKKLPAKQLSDEQTIDAAEKYATAFDSDDRDCIKTDVVNAFYAGVGFAERALKGGK